jgi:hypothetical protein
MIMAGLLFGPIIIYAIVELGLQYNQYIATEDRP